MLLRKLSMVWAVLCIWLSIEYLAGHGILPLQGFLKDFQCLISENCQRFDPRPGRPVSYFFGWAGFCIMALTNLYILMKRVHRFEKWGSIHSWLDWHIFFGLVGPTLIVFHADFKVGGLVAISFWSMVVSFLSGVVGRYIYIQLLQKKTDLRGQLEIYEKGFSEYVRLSRRGIGEKDMEKAKAIALYQATGGVSREGLRRMGILEFAYRSLRGELDMLSHLPVTPWGGGRPIRRKLRNWSLLKRRLIFMHFYHKIFGYWRSFHTPFAFFMYVVALIHIVSSLVFKVH